MDFIRDFSSYLGKYAKLPPSPKSVKQVLEEILGKRGIRTPLGRVTLRDNVLHVLAPSPVKHYLLIHKEEILPELRAKLLTLSISEVR